ncbi:MAG: 3-oxoacyl-ACP reductase [Sciscionella sp.]
MTDRYQQFATSAPGKLLIKQFGLPNPVPLRRYRPGQPLIEGPVLLGAAPGGTLHTTVHSILESARVEIASADSAQRYAGLVFDASGITDTSHLRELFQFFGPAIRKVGRSGRIIVLGTPPEDIKDRRQRAAQRALEGFTRSAGKELRAGAAAQLVYVAAGAANAIESTIRFLLSAKSAYVSGQVIRIEKAAATAPADWERPLVGKVALVTGASRGIGAAIATVLARDGAQVVCLDIPAQGGDLSKVANKVNGSTLQLDITAADAPDKLVQHFSSRFDGLDVAIHNAGITRDKTLGKMDDARWNSVLDVNISAQERINDALLSSGVLHDNGRLIGVSSIAGIAGNFGQTNYGTSKAAVIGHVDALAPEMATHGSTINAVAPGFIETKMTAAIPLFTREAGRRMNSMSQGGLPVDVAETIAWYANPASSGVNGNVVRVCGQSLLGA